MPLRDLRGYLWDVVEACGHVQAFTAGKTLEDYLSDVLLRSAIERQLTIVGEALAQARQHFPEVEGKITHIHQIVGFRNHIIHAYLEIDDETVWGIVHAFVPSLQSEAQAALDELDKGEAIG